MNFWLSLSKLATFALAGRKRGWGRGWSKNKNKPNVFSGMTGEYGKISAKSYPRQPSTRCRDRSLVTVTSHLPLPVVTPTNFRPNFIIYYIFRPNNVNQNNRWNLMQWLLIVGCGECIEKSSLKHGFSRCMIDEFTVLMCLCGWFVATIFPTS